ncbi:hypothetical protein D1610_07025 [Sphingomonas gilva]|uniref:Porin n=1 Tax=Sphingomonas gilva TaxID=2305907 RepID=A0A396RQJ9_9SPHN|nr:putative porin [Sphingomonas gilva]RHW18226.1 hypothetical protein D1610_07025 [Sphingomonas gilva]
MRHDSFLMAGRGTFAAGAVAALMTAWSPVAAQSSSPSDIQVLRQQLDQLRAEQASAVRRISELEAALARQAAKPAPPVATQSAAATPNGGSDGLLDRLDVSGDVRLRYEANFGDRDARNRDRGVLRARLRANYEVNDWLTVGGQIATGDPDDPNTTDVTLSNFDDDLQFSLDQAYVRIASGNLVAYGGKIPLPFARTDLVWDGDVSPQGTSAAYKLPLGSGHAIKATGLYFLIDESVAGSNSDMAGVQIGFESDPAAPLRVELAVGYYDYSLRSVAGADSGDFRSNLIGPDGRYLSDFDLLDGIAAITYQGLGERWPVRLVGNYVKNLGAATDADTGFGVDLFAGRASKPNDWRFGYGYAETEVDAVLAAFSHDNTNIPTNYLQHTLAIDFVPTDNLILNATYYRYRPKDALYSLSNDPLDWLDRVRLNLLVNF